VWFPIEQLKTDTKVSKELRISGMQPYFNAGKVFFPVEENIPLTAPLDVLYHSVPEGVDMLLDELIRFPRATTRDCADALAYMPQLVFPASVIKPLEQAPKGSFEQILKRLVSTRENLLRAGVRSGS
jgi:hypothetical protein